MSGRLEAAPVLEARGLTKVFTVGTGLRPQRLRALHDVSLRLGKGRITALVGESGSGKSTVAKILARLVRPTAGEIVLDGRNVVAEEPRASLAYRGRVQMIFQDPFASLNPAHTIAYHLERPLVRHGKVRGRAERRARVAALLHEVGLDPPDAFTLKRPTELSGGQRQRIAIARALAVEPDVLLADEPTSMLDVSLRMGVLNLMLRLRDERGVALLYVTHDIASARYVSDEISVMYAGQIVESGPAEAVVRRPEHPYTQLLLAAVPDAQQDPLPLPAIKRGAPPLVDVPHGCLFAGRCPDVEPRCRKVPPAVQEPAPGHRVRCHLVRLRSPTEP